MIQKVLAAIVIASVFTSSINAQTTIQVARAAGVGANVNIKGVVLNGAELGGVRYIQDATAGITAYSTTQFGNVNRGDSVQIQGTNKDYKCLLELDPVTSVVTYSSGNALAAPQIITPTGLNEQVEGELVQINNATFNTTGSFVGNTNYTIISGGQTCQVRVSNGTSLVGKAIPTVAVTIIGIGSQFSNSVSCTSGYQLLLRDDNDLVFNGAIALTTEPTVTNITQTGFTINWGTSVAGTNSYVLYGSSPNALSLNAASNNAINHTANITGLQAGSIYYAQVFSIQGSDTAKSLIKVYATQSNSSGVMKAYFNRTVDNSVSLGSNAVFLNTLVDDTLIQYINRAKYTLDIAIYSWDNSSNSNITTAINNAFTRGVKVRIIYDGVPPYPTGLQTINTGIKFMASPQGSNYTIMHNKFVIIDTYSPNANDPILWTGSTNWTNNQLHVDANNVIIFQDQSIAKGYKLEFDEMWGDTIAGGAYNLTNSKFGQFKKDNTPHEYIIGGKRVENYFSPSDGTSSRIVKAVQTANKELYTGNLVITRSDIATAIRNQVQANNLVAYGIVDDTISGGPFAFNTIKQALGANIMVDSHSWIFHHKYLIVDQSVANSDPLVLTGSHNWSTAGETKNDENTVIIHDQNIANQYYQEVIQRLRDNNITPILTGLSSLSSINKASIYPNPTNGLFTIAVSTSKSTSATIFIYDLASRIVKTATHTLVNGDNSIVISATELPKGLYVVKLNAGEEQSIHKLIIE